jgi:hypothetical protein
LWHDRGGQDRIPTRLLDTRRRKSQPEPAKAARLSSRQFHVSHVQPFNLENVATPVAQGPRSESDSNNRRAAVSSAVSAEPLLAAPRFLSVPLADHAAEICSAFAHK